jgi:hypothetical protein
MAYQVNPADLVHPAKAERRMREVNYKIELRFSPFELIMLKIVAILVQCGYFGGTSVFSALD